MPPVPACPAFRQLPHQPWGFKCNLPPPPRIPITSHGCTGISFKAGRPDHPSADTAIQDTRTVWGLYYYYCVHGAHVATPRGTPFFTLILIWDQRRGLDVQDPLWRLVLSRHSSVVPAVPCAPQHPKGCTANVNVINVEKKKINGERFRTVKLFISPPSIQNLWLGVADSICNNAPRRLLSLFSGLPSFFVNCLFNVSTSRPSAKRDFIPVLTFTHIILTGRTEWFKSACNGFTSSQTFRQCCLHAAHIWGCHGWLAKDERPQNGTMLYQASRVLLCIRCSQAPFCINGSWVAAVFTCVTLKSGVGPPPKNEIWLQTNSNNVRLISFYWITT